MTGHGSAVSSGQRSRHPEAVLVPEMDPGLVAQLQRAVDVSEQCGGLSGHRVLGLVGQVLSIAMASETSTIRVNRQTRDLLAEQARERGVSLAAMLGEIADDRRREALWRSEREASRLDAQNPGLDRRSEDE